MKQTGSQNRSRVTGGRPKGRLMAAALLLTVAFMGIVPATSSAVDPSFFVGAPMSPVQATAQVRTVIVSGECLGNPNGVATSNWETATGVAPEPGGVLLGALFSPSDTLRIENQCNGSQSLFIDHANFGNFNMPTLSATPIFSDNATWSANVGGTLNHGKYVDLRFSTSTGRFLFSKMVTWKDDNSAFSKNHGLFAVGDFAVTSGGSSVSQVFGNTTSAISNITVTFSGLGSSGYVNVDNLPDGLVAKTCEHKGIGCSSPLTISGTPTQDGTFNVGFTFTKTDQTITIVKSNSLQIIVGSVISPSTQTVAGTAGTAIAASTAFTESNFTGAVSYAVTTGALPAGLSLSSTTGVVSGTPTAASTATVTITATGATSGTATATVTFAISAAPTPPAPAEIVPPAPETTAPPTTAAPTTAAPGNAPTLVSADNQTALTRTPGSATALVNGQPVEVEVRALADSTGAQTAPEDRSPEQVAELQQAAVALTDRLAAVAGGDIGIEVIATDTGAELSGVFPDMNIPVEDVIVVDVGESATLFAARSPSGDIIKVQPGAVLEVTPEGEVAVIAYGFPVGDQVELVLMSTPTLLGTFIVDASGAIEILANIPDAIGSGDHTLVVASPNVQASLGLTVSDLTQPSVMELPATGTSPANGLVIIMLAMGGLLVLATRRRDMRID